MVPRGLGLPDCEGDTQPLVEVVDDADPVRLEVVVAVAVTELVTLMVG